MRDVMLKPVTGNGSTIYYLFVDFQLIEIFNDPNRALLALKRASETEFSAQFKNGKSKNHR